MAHRFISLISGMATFMVIAQANAVGASVRPAIISGAATLAPFQHVRFCARYPEECKSAPRTSEHVDLDERTMSLIKQVNRDVNATITPLVKTYGQNLEDSWAIGPAQGDCNDYAVTKRHELISQGVNAAALRLSVVITPSGIGHLVVVVMTSKGELVLDNLTQAIRPWYETSYRWLKIQSATDPKLWHEVKAPADRLALSATEYKIRVADSLR